jgi:hypothetical protein
MDHGAWPVREGETRRGKKSRLAVKMGPKDLRKYRKRLIIFRTYVLNEIQSYSNELYSKPNSRAHINTKINASGMKMQQTNYINNKLI